jgi:hypothetical protein
MPDPVYRTLTPKYAKNKKPVKVRKPSKPIDGINHRLLREQAEAAAQAEPKQQLRSWKPWTQHQKTTQPQLAQSWRPRPQN